MTDTEMRSIVLREFYDKRQQGMLFIEPEGKTAEDFDGIEPKEYLRIALQLSEHGLLSLKSLANHRGEPRLAHGTISAEGVDVMEGNRKPPIAVNIDQRQTVTVTGSHNVQVAGANSSQNQTITNGLEQLIDAIKKSPMPEEQKKSALESFKRFLSEPATVATIPVVVGKLFELLPK